MINDIHQWAEERLSEYMDNQLAPSERLQLQAHIRDCDRCRSSLESLRWSVSLLKQAPAPAPTRQFTIPVTRSESRVSRTSFGLLRVATALATILLCVLVSFDLFMQFSAAPALAPIPAAQYAAPPPTQNIALAPTAAPAATSAPPTAAAAPQSTSAPQAAAPPAALPTASRALPAGVAEVQATTAQADQALKSSSTIPAPPPAPRVATTNTASATSASPTSASVPSATVPLPTATTQVQARVEPTRGRDAIAEPGRAVAPLRLLELGLLAMVVLLGVLTIFTWRRK